MSEKPQLRLAGLIDRRKPGAWGVPSLCGVMPKQWIFRALLVLGNSSKILFRHPLRKKLTEGLTEEWASDLTGELA